MRDRELSRRVAEARGDRLEKEFLPGKKSVVWRSNNYDLSHQKYPRPYATNISCATELMDLWKRQTEWVGITWENGEWCVSWTHSAVDKQIWAIDEELCRAICKCFLLFCEYNREPND